MGREEGDEVVVQTPAGPRRFEILQLKTLHDELAEKAARDGESS